jgi:GDP-mannose 4,6 dehydratase
MSHSRLVTQGHDVLCVDNFYTGTKDNIAHLLDCANFELMRHDVTFPLYVEVDEIYNLACPASPIHYQHDPVQTTKTSVHGAINMLGLAKRVFLEVIVTPCLQLRARVGSKKLGCGAAFSYFPKPSPLRRFRKTRMRECPLAWPMSNLRIGNRQAYFAALAPGSRGWRHAPVDFLALPPIASQQRSIPYTPEDGREDANSVASKNTLSIWRRCFSGGKHLSPDTLLCDGRGERHTVR